MNPETDPVLSPRIRVNRETVQVCPPLEKIPEIVPELAKYAQYSYEIISL